MGGTNGNGSTGRITVGLSQGRHLPMSSPKATKAIAHARPKKMKAEEQIPFDEAGKGGFEDF